MGCIPVWQFAPLFLVSHNIHNLTHGPRLPGLLGVLLGKDKATTSDPYRVPEALRKLEQQRLLVGQLTGIQVVSLGLHHTHNGLIGLERVWRGQ